MELIPGHNKRTAQYASEDSHRTTHADDGRKAPQDSNRTAATTPGADVQRATGKDANRADAQRGKSMSKKPFFNKAIHAACLEKGFSAEDADKFARTPPEDDDDDKKDDDKKDAEPEDKVKKALDEVADLIKSGQHLYTQADIDELRTQYTDVQDRIVKSFDVSMTKVRDRLGGLEKAFLALHEQQDALTKALVESNDLNKAFAIMADDLKKAITTPAPAAVPVVEDPLKKGITDDNKPVDEPRAAVIPSPLEEPVKDADVGITHEKIRDTAKDLLKKGGISGADRAHLGDAIMDSLSGRSVDMILKAHGQSLGLKA